MTDKQLMVMVAFSVVVYGIGFLRGLMRAEDKGK